MLELRDYQRECLESIEQHGKGRWLVCLATGMGKTVVFTSIPNNFGKTLVLAHREELIHQPVKYYNCPVGLEQAKHTSNGEEVVIASVQSLVRRLGRFNADHFGRIIIDEAHHAVANSYKKIIEHFSGVKQLLGVTATPARGDKVGLEKVFDKIIFERGLRWGIENNYLCDIECLRVGISYDLSSVRLKGGDYAVGELEEEMAETSEEIAAVYKEHAKGQTIIFAVSVKHAHDIADAIGSDAVAIDANTKNRADIFKNPPPCIVNCMVLTEGFDMPSIQTVIMARPTKNKSLYQQCVGRGTRLYKDKEKLRLIDCVGVSDIDMCTAPTLLGIDISSMPKERKEKLQSENLADLESLVQINSDTVENWMINTKIVDLWAKSERYNTHDINFFKLATGELLVLNYRIKPQDQLGTGMQEKIDFLFEHLRQNHQNEKHIWDKNIAKSWGKYPASEKQMEHIRRIYPDMGMITKLEASNILTRMWGAKNKKIVDVEF